MPIAPISLAQSPVNWTQFYQIFRCANNDNMVRLIGNPVGRHVRLTLYVCAQSGITVYKLISGKHFGRSFWPQKRLPYSFWQKFNLKIVCSLVRITVPLYSSYRQRRIHTQLEWWKHTNGAVFQLWFWFWFHWQVGSLSVPVSRIKNLLPVHPFFFFSQSMIFKEEDNLNSRKKMPK